MKGIEKVEKFRRKGTSLIKITRDEWLYYTIALNLKPFIQQLTHQLWVETSKMEQHFRNYVPNKWQISGKRYRMFLRETEKNESKKIKTYSEITRADYPQCNQRRESHSSRTNVYRKTDLELRNSHIWKHWYST